MSRRILKNKKRSYTQTISRGDSRGEFLADPLKFVTRKLLELSEDKLNSNIRALIEIWPNPPTPINVLEALDKSLDLCIDKDSDYVVNVLRMFYDIILVSYDSSHEEVLKLAHWRK